MTETTENVTNENTPDAPVSNRRVRSSFTMATEVMVALKERATKEDLSVSAVIEKAVAQYLGQ